MKKQEKGDVKTEEKGAVRGEDTGNVAEPKKTKRKKKRKTPLSPGY
jgi:hypothetical protein